MKNPGTVTPPLSGDRTPPSEAELLDAAQQGFAAAKGCGCYRCVTAFDGLAWIRDNLPALLADRARVDWMEAHPRPVFAPLPGYRAWTVQGGRDCKSLREAIDDTIARAPGASGSGT